MAWTYTRAQILGQVDGYLENALAAQSDSAITQYLDGAGGLSLAVLARVWDRVIVHEFGDLDTGHDITREQILTRIEQYLVSAQGAATAAEREKLIGWCQSLSLVVLARCFDVIVKNSLNDQDTL